jgi:hypothetical protein
MAPTCYSKVVVDPRWIVAMAPEFDALMSNSTWNLFPRLTTHKIIRNKLVNKIKQCANGSIDRFKAQLVTKGFHKKKWY